MARYGQRKVWSTYDISSCHSSSSYYLMSMQSSPAIPLIQSLSVVQSSPPATPFIQSSPGMSVSSRLFLSTNCLLECCPVVSSCNSHPVIICCPVIFSCHFCHSVISWHIYCPWHLLPPSLLSYPFPKFNCSCFTTSKVTNFAHVLTSAEPIAAMEAKKGRRIWGKGG